MLEEMLDRVRFAERQNELVRVDVLQRLGGDRLGARVQLDAQLVYAVVHGATELTHLVRVQRVVAVLLVLVGQQLLQVLLVVQLAGFRSVRDRLLLDEDQVLVAYDLEQPQRGVRRRGLGRIGLDQSILHVHDQLDQLLRVRPRAVVRVDHLVQNGQYLLGGRIEAFRLAGGVE